MKMGGLLGGYWAIEEGALERIIASVEAFEGNPKAGLFGDGGAGGSYAVENGIATIALKGPIVQEKTLLSQFIAMIFGGTMLPDFVAQMQAAEADPKVHSVLMDVNSPGGDAMGIEAAARAIGGMSKPVMAYVDGMAASAAYWLASASNLIVLSGDTSQVGSIGVVLGMRDAREADAKAGVKRHEIVSSQSPLKRVDPATDEGMAVLKTYVDALAEVFITNVARGRSVEVAKVKTEFGKGAMVLGSDAIARGMADGISSRDGLMQMMRSGRVEFGGSAANNQRGERKTMKTPEELAAEQKAADEKARVEAEAKAKADGEKAGAGTERARIAAILGSDEAKDRPKLAQKLAMETDMSVDQAKVILGAAAKESASDPLAGAMAGVKNPKVGTDNGADASDEDKEVGAILAAHRKARGVKEDK